MRSAIFHSCHMHCGHKNGSPGCNPTPNGNSSRISNIQTKPAFALPIKRIPFSPSVLSSTSMQTYLALAIPILVTTLWLYTAHLARSTFPKLRSKRICLLIAHPDDEAMFFSPTLLELTRAEAGNHVKILCLSSGTYSTQWLRDHVLCRTEKGGEGGQ